MKPRLILFDIDGTLVITHGAGRAASSAALLETFGTQGRIDQHQFSGKTDWYTLLELLTVEGFAEEEILGRFPLFVENVGKHLEQIIPTYPVQACPGALETVRDLLDDPNVRLGLVTGNVPTTAPIKLRAGGFDPSWFPVGAFGTDARDRNALPTLAIERARRHYGIAFDPHEVIIIGDTEMDVACARFAGAIAVAVKTGFASVDVLLAAQPDFLLDDLTTFRQTVLLS